MKDTYLKFKDGNITSEELKTFLFSEMALYMKQLRVKAPGGSLRVMLSDEQYSVIKSNKEFYLALGTALDYLTEKPVEMGEKADALFREQPELVTCKSLSRVFWALHNYKLKQISLWVVFAIIAGILVSLTAIGLMSYYWGSR